VKALVTERVGKGVAWMPYHFGGWFGGADLRKNYPKDTDPVVLGGPCARSKAHNKLSAVRYRHRVKKGQNEHRLS
jgi:hypothetical protein